MIEKNYFSRAGTFIILAVLIILSFFVIKPILISIITGIVLAFVFVPIYSKLYEKIKSKNFAAFLVCSILVILVVVPTWFIAPILLEESIAVFTASQEMDFVTPIKTAFPSLFATEEFGQEITRTIYSFVTGITTGIMGLITGFLIGIPNFLLHLMIAIFTFFFVLRDNKEFVEYIKSLLPFSEKIEKKLFSSSKEITLSILFGQIVIGILQGIFAGASFYIFGVENALFLTIIAMVAGVFPIIGTSIVWIPVAIYSFVIGDFLAAMGVAVFGALAGFFENAIKPAMISKRTQIHSGLILIGMVGGIYLFGMFGFILGPLILAYLLIVLELFKTKKTKSIFITEPRRIKNK